MAKTKAPLFGFGASGKLGDAIVFGTWKGIGVAREYVVPANPQTPLQQAQRARFSAAVAEWQSTGASQLDADDKLAWDRYAGVLGPMSGFNAFTKVWVDEEVAGGTPPGHVYGVNNTDASATAFDVLASVTGGNADDVTLRLGNSKTFFATSATETPSLGLATFTGIATNFPAGTTVWYYFEQGVVGDDYIRSGLYTATLT